jgi:hypothetical protein
MRISRASEVSCTIQRRVKYAFNETVRMFPVGMCSASAFSMSSLTAWAALTSFTSDGCV